VRHPIRAARRRRIGVLMTSCAVTVLAAGSIGLAPAASAGPGVVLAAAESAVPGSYLVVLDDRATAAPGVPDAARSLTGRYGGEVGAVWQHAVRGFAARMSAAQAGRMAADPRVAYVEQDAVARLQGTQLSPPSWGLDRIDQRTLPLDGLYVYPVRPVTSVRVYVIDTGIRTTHSSFNWPYVGLATWGTNTTGDGNDTDCNGHGTHVAGTIGGWDYGVAKNARLVAVKAVHCDGSGTTASIVDAINWVTANAVKPAVANMSLRVAGSTTIDTAVNNSIAQRITYVVGAGNENRPACNYSPARVPDAVTVTASDRDDNRPWWPNYGTCVDLYAPGQDITSAWHTGDNASYTTSGTSMSTPHVSGAAAMYLQVNPSATPAQVAAWLRCMATPGAIAGNPAGTPNLLLYVPPTIGAC